jgi:hypothetical protein
MSKSTIIGSIVGVVVSWCVWMLAAAEAVVPATTSTTTTEVVVTTTTEVVRPAPSTTTTSTTTTTTTTLLAGEWACPEAITLAAKVGWPVDELDKLDAVIWRESRCDPSARSTTNDTGLTQVNDFWCRSTAAFPDGFLQTAGVVDDCTDLFDPETSLRASLVIWQRSGWSPWGG